MHGTPQASFRPSTLPRSSNPPATLHGTWTAVPAPTWPTTRVNSPPSVLHLRLIHLVLLLAMGLLFLLGNGSAHLRFPSSNFILHHVLHTPDLVKNLVSVWQFTKHNSCSVEFDPIGFSVKDLRTKRELLRANSSGDLYPFPGSTTVTSSHALTAHSSADIWHQ